MRGFSEVVSEGDQRASLEALRDELARSLESADVAVKAQISAQLRATLKDIAALPDATVRTKADELADRRRARRAAAKLAAPAAGEGQ